METQLGYWRWKLFRWNDHPNPYLNRADVALTWLSQFKGNPAIMQELQELLGTTATGGYGQTDPSVILEQLAQKMSTGEIQVCAEVLGTTKLTADFAIDAEAEPDLSELHVDAAPPAPAPAEEPEAATLESYNDAAQQAAVLQDAADEGTPFCEECEKPPLEEEQPASTGALSDSLLSDPKQENTLGQDNNPYAQAEVLKEAADKGAHFCELCAKLAEERPLEDEEEDDFGPSSDVPTQVQVLKAAAKKGTHFCAICEKMAQEARAKEAAEATASRQPAPPRQQTFSSPPTFGTDNDAEIQAQVLREAAASGDHFCAVCEAAREEQERSGSS